MHFDRKQYFGCLNCQHWLIVEAPYIALKVCSNCGAVHENTLLGVVHKDKLFSQIPEDMSLICLGTKGQLNSIDFEVKGRRRLVFEGGYYRNEWFLQFTNNSSGWLIEIYNQYYFTPHIFTTLEYRVVRELGIGSGYKINKHAKFYLETIIKLIDYKFEGELPNLKPYKSLNLYRTLELVNSDYELLSIELFSKDDIQYTLSKSVLLEELNLNALRIADGWN